MSKKVVIVDYELGNLFSVLQACLHVGMDVEISNDPAKVAAADGLILPGVGAFGTAMENLRKRGIEEPLKAQVAAGKPFLGICLGLQLLFTDSVEFGSKGGLDLLPGKVVRIPSEMNGQKVRVPQIGWNTIHAPRPGAWQGTPLAHLQEGAYMYFVHSYHVVPSRPEDILTLTNYVGLEYCSGVKRDNILALQFHPEKSGPEGVEVYRDWARGNGLV
ncbi:MAG: imidazole glycerol phosphate synthase subunit HisH [Bacteroidia bacterium]